MRTTIKAIAALAGGFSNRKPFVFIRIITAPDTRMRHGDSTRFIDHSDMLYSAR